MIDGLISNLNHWYYVAHFCIIDFLVLLEPFYKKYIYDMLIYIFGINYLDKFKVINFVLCQAAKKLRDLPDQHYKSSNCAVNGAVNGNGIAHLPSQ